MCACKSAVWNTIIRLINASAKALASGHAVIARDGTPLETSSGHRFFEMTKTDAQEFADLIASGEALVSVYGAVTIGCKLMGVDSNPYRTALMNWLGVDSLGTDFCEKYPNPRVRSLTLDGLTALYQSAARDEADAERAAAKAAADAERARQDRLKADRERRIREAAVAVEAAEAAAKAAQDRLASALVGTVLNPVYAPQVKVVLVTEPTPYVRPRATTKFTF